MLHQQRLFSLERRFEKDGQKYLEKVFANCIQKSKEKEALCTLTTDTFFVPTPSKTEPVCNKSYFLYNLYNMVFIDGAYFGE